MDQSRRVLTASFILILTALGLTSCNFFGGIDTPSGDAQNYSAAVSCQDQGDFACAIKYYNQLSSSDNDIKQSGLAFADLEAAGIGMLQFSTAFGNGKNINIGTAMTSLANAIIPLGPGSALRTRIYQDYSNEATMTPNSSLQALVRFLAGISFAAEILAEAATSVGSAQLLQTDIATNPSACSANPLACVAPAGTTVSAGINGVPQTAVNQLLDGLTTLDAEAKAGSSTANISSGTFVLNMFVVSLKDISNALGVLGQAGAFGSSFSTFITQFGMVATDPAVRGAILIEGIGN